MKRYLLLLLLVILTLGSFGQLNFTFSVCNDGTALSGVNVLGENDIIWTMAKNGCSVKSNTPDASAWALYDQGGMNILVLDPGTDVGNKCGALTLGDVITVSIDVSNPAHPLYGKTANYEVTINSFSSDQYQFLCGLNFAATVPSISVGNLTMCAGETGKTVTATITNPPANIADYTIQWEGGITTSGAVGATSTGNVPSTIAAGSYKAKLLDNVGNEVSSATFTVTVNMPPTLAITPTTGQADGTGAAYYCQGTGDKANVALSVSGADNTYTYQWKKGNASAGTGNSVSVNSAGTYTVSATSTNGCPAEKTVTVNEYTRPGNVAITNTLADVCSNAGSGSTTLTHGAATAGTGGGTVNYTWSGGSVNASTGVVDNTTVATTAAGTTYTLKATDDKCSATTTYTLKGHKLSPALTPASQSVASGTEVAMTVAPNQVPNGTGGTVSYDWTVSSSNLKNPSTAATAASIGVTSTTSPAKYKVKVSDDYCKDVLTNEVTYTLQAGSEVEIASINGGSKCDAAVTVTASVSKGTGPYTYQWTSDPAGLTFNPASGSTTGNISSAASGNPGKYKAKLTVTDSKNVSKTSETDVTIWGKPSLTDVTVTSSDKCKDDAVELSANGGAAAATVLDNSATLTYVWTGAAKKADQTKASATLAAGDNTYKVKIRDGNGCESSEQSVTYVGHEVKVTAMIDGSSVTKNVAYGSQSTLSSTVVFNPSASTPTPAVQNYSWTGGEGIDGDNTQATATTVALTTGGRYTLTVVDNFGCTGKDDIDYTVTGGRMSVTTNPVYLCAASETTLSCTVTNGTGGTPDYTWISVDGNLTFDNPKAEHPKVTTTVPGKYKIKVEVKQGVQTATSAEVEITIGAQPTLKNIAIFCNGNLVPDPSGTVLPGSKVDVKVTPDNIPPTAHYYWTSTPAGIIESISADSLTASSKALTAGVSRCFKLEVVNEDGKCPASQEACVPVTGTEFKVEMPDATLCEGSELLVTSVNHVSGGVKNYARYTWTCADPDFQYTESGDHTYITVNSTTPVKVYTVNLEVEDQKGNIASDEFTVTVGTMPVFTSAPASPQNSMVGSTVNLSATTRPATATVNWTPAGPVQGAQTGGIGYAEIVAGAFTSQGAYNYTVRARVGECYIDSIVTVNVKEKVDDITIVANDVEACEGENAVITANATGGSGNLSYRWEVISGDIVLSSTTGRTTTVRSASVGPHTVRVTVSDNSTTDPVVKDIKVTVYAKPVINSIVADNVTSGASNVTTVDFGDELKLTGSVSPADADCGWTADRDVLISPNGSTVYTKPLTGNTHFTLTATNEHRCSATKDINIVVKEPETGALLRLELVKKCADSGENMVLTMTATGGTTYSFRLRNNAGLDSLFKGAGPWRYEISLGGQDTYFAQNFQAFKNGVEIRPAQVAPAQIEALFYTTPVITVAGGNTQNVCEGNELTLSASAQLSNTEFEWDNTDVVNGRPFFPQTSGTYTVTATTDQGCKATSRVDVTIIPKPTVTIEASSNEICLGDTVILKAGGSATEFVWNNGQTGEQIVLVPDVGGTIKYVVTGTETLNGCKKEASVDIVVNEPPVIVSTSRPTRSIAIGKNVTYSVKASGKELKYEWQRWTGSGWLTMYDGADDQPGIAGARTDSLTLSNVPMSWNDTKLKCIVSNPCGTVDTTFLLYVKECFDILDVEWSMCEGIRPETDPSVQVDGWYCPGTRIAVCAKLILEDPDAEVGDAVYRWTVDGLSTEDGRWGEMVFISDSSVLSWIPPASWQDNITIALCAYVDEACDTVCKSYLRLKATAFSDMDWKLLTSVDPSRKFCPGDTVTCWIDDPNRSAGLHPTYHWYNDIFDLETEPSANNEVISLTNEKVILAMGQKDTWMKVVMKPSPEICTRQGEYVDTAFLSLKQTVEPEFSIWCEDTLACINDEIYLEAHWKNAGEHPKFQWTRSIGYPYWNLGNEYYARTQLDENDVWIKCQLTPSDEVCFRQDTVFTDAIQIRVIKDPEVVIFADLENKVQGDEIIVESDISKMPVKDPSYTWYVNNRIEPKETEEELISADFKQGDKVQLGVKGERICQNLIMSNILEIDFDNAARDTLITIYRGERVRNLDLMKPGDEVKEFSIAEGGYTGSGQVFMGLDGKFSYVPHSMFVGMEKVTYVIYNKYTGAIETGHIYIQVKDKDRFFIPNIITPNGDGMNDVWKLDFLTEYPDHKLTVYNRYGKVVFRADHYNNDWDGSGQGNAGYVAYFNLPNGIYTYVIDLGNKEILKGWVEIRKNMNLGRYSK